MTEDSHQKEIVEDIGSRLANLLREANDLGGRGEEALDQYMASLDDSVVLADRMKSINFGYGVGVVDSIPSWSVRYSFATEEDPKGEIQTDVALALLLINEVIFTNTLCHEQEEGDPVKSNYLGVLCNDVFAWGCSDCEDITQDQIDDLFTMWEKDPKWGSAIWCMIQRKELPQRPILKSITDAGIWDIDDLTKTHHLRQNHYDGVSRIWAEHKYETYTNWCKSQNKEPLVFDKHWWQGWKEFTKANPEWYTDAWKAEENRRTNVWRVENGYDPR